MQLNEFIRNLKLNGLIPKNIEVSSWHGWSLVSCFDNVSSKYISESVSMGIDLNPEIAMFKGLTEYCERKLSKVSVDPLDLQTARSDGYAAFPSDGVSDSLSQSMARDNALNEAVERYLWSEWWDCHEVEFLISDFEDSALVNKLIGNFKIRKVNKVVVRSFNFDQQLLILIAETNTGGFVTGGAAGLGLEINKTIARAFGELLRHCLVYERMISKDQNELSFYETRLLGFASGKWSSAVKERLEKKGTDVVIMPNLIIDKAVMHDYANLISLHRCLFENQKPFMGGRVDRLCI